MSTPRKKKGDKANGAPAKPKPGTAPEHVDNVERVRIEKEMPVAASTQEVQRMSLEHAKVTLAIKALNDEIAAFMADKRKKRRELVKEDLRLAHAINGNVVMKRVSCTEERHFNTMTLRWVDDTGKLLDEKPMPKEMLQRDFLDSPPAGDRVEAEEEDEDAEAEADAE